MKKLVLCLARASVLAGALAATLAAPAAHAHRDSAASELSALSALPIAVSVAAPAVLLSAGAAFTVVAVASTAGWVLSAAGKAIAFIPNEMGRALLHNERVTR